MEQKSGQQNEGPASPDNKATVNAVNTKLIRLLTVIAYVCSVSMAAVMLSLYYVFLWDPSSHKSGTPAAFQQQPAYPSSGSQFAGDSSIATSTSPILRHLANGYTIGRLCFLNFHLLISHFIFSFGVIFFPSIHQL